MARKEGDRSLTGLLDRIDSAGDGPRVSFRDMMRQIGGHAITPFILMVAILVVSPLSGIPGTPTVSGLLIATMAVQALSGRKKLWLPRFLLRKQVKVIYVHRAVDWLRKPCAFLDHHTQKRLAFLTAGPMRWITLTVCAVLPLTWPLLEVLPMVTSVSAAILALMVFGLFTRDGVYVLWGYLLLSVAIGATAALL
jgi:hypothetical protein